MLVNCTFDARHTYNVCILYMIYVGLHYIMNNGVNYRDRKVNPAIVPSGVSL